MPEKHNDQILSRSPNQFSKKFQTILYSEPKHLAIMGFYLIFATAIILGTWSFLTTVNKSYVIKGEIIHLIPDISIRPNHSFEFRRHTTHIGQVVKKGDILFEYYDQEKRIVPFFSRTEGSVSQKADLKQGVLYPVSTEVITIRPEEEDTAVRLYIPDNLLNKVKIGNKVIYHFNFSFGPKNKIIEGTILTEPMLNNNQYVVEAKIDDESLKFLTEQKIKLISGLPVTTEMIIGKERLISRFLGVKL
ncbi:MAG: HlyD family efflux transporter periplasmic adaptor subunit [Proteobacteria bacterium]|nr:HlyD family efflux transporter periplasmic adaptor subunit [Pseudomonadota bacterium]